MQRDANERNGAFIEHNLARPTSIRYIASAAKSTFSPREVCKI